MLNRNLSDSQDRPAEISIDRLFLTYSVNKLRQLSASIETCLGKLSDEQVWARGNENENAIGNLALHLCGNVRQWIVTGVGGHPYLRERDAEFAARGGVARAELSERLRQTVEEAVTTIDAVALADLQRRLLIQEYDVSILEAIYHVVEHFSMHAGQIIFATKMLTGEDLGFYQHLRSGSGHDRKTP
jgi:uncharacterized damage-inducible protein DinB